MTCGCTTPRCRWPRTTTCTTTRPRHAVSAMLILWDGAQIIDAGRGLRGQRRAGRGTPGHHAATPCSARPPRTPFCPPTRTKRRASRDGGRGRPAVHVADRPIEDLGEGQLTSGRPNTVTPATAGRPQSAQEKDRQHPGEAGHDLPVVPCRRPSRSGDVNARTPGPPDRMGVGLSEFGRPRTGVSGEQMAGLGRDITLVGLYRPCQGF